MISDLARHTEKLYYFYEIAKLGSLHACARKLSVSPPTLSYSLKQLEQVTQTSLFVRSKEGMSLTPSGEHLFHFCKRFYKELESLDGLLKTPEKDPVIRVRVGTFSSIALYFWPHLMEALKIHPSLSLSIMTQRSPQVIEALIKKDIDLALTVEAKSKSKLIHHKLYTDSYQLYGSKKLSTSKLKKSELLKLSFMFIPDALDQNGVYLHQHVHSWGLTFKEEFSIDSFEVISEFIKRNYGIGVLPTQVAKNYKKDLVPIQVEGGPKKSFGPHRFFLSYREDLDLPQSLMNFFVNAAKLSVEQLNK